MNQVRKYINKYSFGVNVVIPSETHSPKLFMNRGKLTRILQLSLSLYVWMDVR